MDQLVKEETQRLLANQARDARIQRQKQVRQQAIAWTEATRRKFEEAKEREIKTLAGTVTAQVQNAAIQNIEQLSRQNDLAMAEIGMAHRAAAGYQNVQRLKSLKRLKNDEVASNRGSAAMIRHLKQKQADKSKSLAIVKRKEEVRKVEDKLSKDLISRRPLTVSNSNIDSKVKKLGPPEYQQSIAKTLKVAADDEQGVKASQPPKSSKQLDRVISKKMQDKDTHVPTSSSSDLIMKNKKNQTSKTGLLQKMVRIKATSPSTAGVNFESDQAQGDFSHVKDIYGTAYKLRMKYMKAAKGSTPHIPTPIQSKVRYFDSTIPKGEVKYLAPPGLAVKEARKSPDAWEKGRKTSEESLQQQRSKALKEEEIAQKANERGKLAMKKAKLEKEILEVRNELLDEIDFDFLGTGSQKAILGLDEGENQADEANVLKTLHHSHSSDEFSAVDSDEEFAFPSPPHSTLKNYSVQPNPFDDDKAVLTLKPRLSSNSLIKASSSTDSFDSYSTPSVHSIEDEIPETEKINAQHLDAGAKEDNPKRIPKHKNDHDTVRPKVKAKKTSSAAFVNPPQPDSKKDHSEDNLALAELYPMSGAFEDSSARKTLSDEKPRSKKSSYSKSTRKREKDPGVTRPSKSESLLNLHESKELTKDKDSLTSVTSYSPPSLNSSEDKLTKKPKRKQQSHHSSENVSVEDKNQSENNFSGKDKDPSGENLPSKRRGKSTLDKIVDSMLFSSQHEDDDTNPKVADRSKSKASVSSINSSDSSGKVKGASRQSSSSSTIAEINIRTTSATATEIPPSDRKTIKASSHSLQELHDKAKKQEKDLFESLTGLSSLSDFQEGRRLDKKAAPSDLVSKPKVANSASQTRKPSMEKKETTTSRKKSHSLSSSTNTSSSDQSSALVNIKIKQVEDSTDSPHSQSSATPISSISKSNSNSDESSALVNLKILENSETTPSRSEQSSSGTTDYYSPPDGPFTSTPDGKLLPKSSPQRSSDNSSSIDGIRRATLYHYLDKFMKRRPESIEQLPVSSSSSSVVRADSDVVESESFTDSYNTHMKDEGHTTKSSSDFSSTSNKGLSTLHEEHTDTDHGSGSTIAETAIVAGRVVTDSSTHTDSTIGSSLQKGESPIVARNSSSSCSDPELVSADSLIGLLKVLSHHQVVEKQQLHYDNSNNPHPQELEQSSATTSHNASGSNNQSRNNEVLDSSRESIPDANAIIKRLMSRQTARNSSRSSGSSSPKSGPEKEEKRIELLDDITPIRLWETPPRTSQAGANDTEKLSEVFENLIDKWSNMRIEKPPWTPSDSSQK